MEKEKRVAEILLEIGAVSLRPSEPFRWASGIMAPIYTDNRILMSNIPQRREVIDFMVKTIEEKIGANSFDIIGGIATSGIPHAAWVSEKMGKPMIYARGKQKDHGKENLVEGKLEEGKKVVMIEDLVSTGESSIRGIEAVRSGGGECSYCLSIFTYELEKAKKNFEETKVRLYPMTNFSTLVNTALDRGYIKEEEVQPALEWGKNPEGWGEERGFE